MLQGEFHEIKAIMGKSRELGMRIIGLLRDGFSEADLTARTASLLGFRICLGCGLLSLLEWY